MAEAVRGRFIYSGGIGALDDLRGLAALRQVNLAGVIVGKALYEGRFTITEGQAALDLRVRIRRGRAGGRGRGDRRSSTRPSSGWSRAGRRASGAPSRCPRTRGWSPACDAWAAGDGLWMAEIDGVTGGALVVGERPEHVHPVEVEELYIELLLSSRAHAGKRIGARLVAHATSGSERGERLLRVDCWAGAPRLVRSTRTRGSSRTGRSSGGWKGQVFSMRLGHQPGTSLR